MLGRTMIGKLGIAYRVRAQGDGVPIVVGVRESRTQGEGGKVDLEVGSKVGDMPIC